MAISFDQPLRPAVQQMSTQIDDTLDFSGRIRIGYQVATVPAFDGNSFPITVTFDEPFESTDLVSVIPTYVNSWNPWVTILGCSPVTYEGFTVYVENATEEAQELHLGYLAFKIN